MEGMTQQQIIGYLLGEASEAESSALEQAYFSDPQLFDRIVAAESDLLDSYARGQLPSEQRRRFETHYLSNPQRREHARFAEALAAKIDSLSQVPAPSSTRMSWWNRLFAITSWPRVAWALPVLLVLLATSVVWLAIQTRSLRQERSRNETERVSQEQKQHDLQQRVANERARADQLAAELDRLRSQQTTTIVNSAPIKPPSPAAPSSPSIATLALAIGGVRGSQTGPPSTFLIPPGAERARIRLNLSDNDYSTYAVLVQSASGKQIFRSDGLRSRTKTGATLSVIIPAKRFASGDYILTLKGTTPGGEVEDVSKSLFRVSQNRRR
jgi:anti-sigma factor RsiW